VDLLSQIKSERRELDDLLTRVEGKASWISVAEDFLRDPLFRNIPADWYVRPGQLCHGKIVLISSSEGYPWAHKINGNYIVEIEEAGGLIRFFSIKDIFKEISENAVIDITDNLHSYPRDPIFSYDSRDREHSLKRFSEFYSSLKKDYRYSDEIIELILADLRSREGIGEVVSESLEMRVKEEIKDLVV
jgi:hypothetical protein